MTTVEETHKAFMTEALKEANRALQKGEVPVGAVVVCNNRIVARAHNLTESLNDPTAHAEMQAITAATSYLGGKYLDQCALYVTLEPCVMCAGALFWSQLGTLVYGASDPKRGYTLLSDQIIHPKTKVVKGILKDESADILQRFFAQKRGKD
ncbi:MAG: nucleoside deaminase [Tenuifilaceae bacterium]|jgi:tRNA(adenine34) deaminase|nr:nucleoside deaminase [Bacteroidales bacterium]MDI9517068.1 nucleoside deaminase [Bacteroidota bacterium]NLH56900.1 nucleoside deaminase [Rikenellaceae bacterium]OQC64314.1 MAG: tRNA-specific adenosine deaminase [Bacteroidetes bacterium ADurb.Bin008]HOF92441.1 nucleoside deaminase [Tenuifilaceae bacterium]